MSFRHTERVTAPPKSQDSEVVRRTKGALRQPGRDWTRERTTRPSEARPQDPTPPPRSQEQTGGGQQGGSKGAHEPTWWWGQALSLPELNTQWLDSNLRIQNKNNKQGKTGDDIYCGESLTFYIVGERLTAFKGWAYRLFRESERGPASYSATAFAKGCVGIIWEFHMSTGTNGANWMARHEMVWPAG